MRCLKIPTFNKNTADDSQLTCLRGPTDRAGRCVTGTIHLAICFFSASLTNPSSSILQSRTGWNTSPIMGRQLIMHYQLVPLATDQCLAGGTRPFLSFRTILSSSLQFSYFLLLIRCWRSDQIAAELLFDNPFEIAFNYCGGAPTQRGWLCQKFHQFLTKWHRSFYCFQINAICVQTPVRKVNAFVCIHVGDLYRTEKVRRGRKRV